MALVLTRKRMERVLITDGTETIEVVIAKGGKVRLAISAPDRWRIFRSELDQDKGDDHGETPRRN